MRIEVRRAHNLSKDEAKRRADRFAAKVAEEFHPHGMWYGDRYVFHVTEGLASGVGGYVELSDNEIHVLVDLPGLLSLLKKQVEAKITEELTVLLR